MVKVNVKIEEIFKKGYFKKKRTKSQLHWSVCSDEVHTNEMCDKANRAKPVININVEREWEREKSASEIKRVR